MLERSCAALRQTASRAAVGPSRARHIILHTLFLILFAIPGLAGCDAPVPASTATPTPSAISTPVASASTAGRPATIVQAVPTKAAQEPTSLVASGKATSPPAQTTRSPASPAVAPGQSPTSAFLAGTPSPTLLPAAERAEVFDSVWETVKEHYLYSDFRGLDWKVTRAEYRQRALDASSAAEFYAAIREMVSKLKDDHSYYLSPWDTVEEDRHINGDVSYVGIGVLYQREDNDILVVYVIPRSPAENAGLQRRDRIMAVNGHALSAGEESTEIRGPVGTTVRLTVKSPGTDSREISITRANIKSSIYPSVHRLEGHKDLGYLFIPDLWTGDMSRKVEFGLLDIFDGTPLRGLVVDLRGNGGGLRTSLEGILGQFVTGDVGSFYSQSGTYPLKITKGGFYNRLKDVPVVVLVDKGTVSYAEVLAGVLQSRKRAQVVGVTSLGNTETIYPYDMKDGSRVWVAQEGFRLPDGTNLEGRGVIPDYPAAENWTEYSEQDDPHIIEAIKLLEQAGTR